MEWNDLSLCRSMMDLSRTKLLLALILAVVPGACQPARITQAETIAAQGGLTRQDISIESFTLASWRRIGHSNDEMNIYIEGDGLAWLSRSQPSLDPTPTNPVALELASADSSPNVLYLARPCQYVTGTHCDARLWTDARYSPQVISAYMQALDVIKKETGARRFALIGFSGGAQIAGLLAASRHDVTSLRTVAGNLDHAALNALHGVSAMPASLNMADWASVLSRLPQLHVTGGRDKVVPQSIFERYYARSGRSTCIVHEVIEDAAHISSAWAQHWPGLLQRRLFCE